MPDKKDIDNVFLAALAILPTAQLRIGLVKQRFLLKNSYLDLQAAESLGKFAQRQQIIAWGKLSKCQLELKSSKEVNGVLRAELLHLRAEEAKVANQGGRQHQALEATVEGLKSRLEEALGLGSLLRKEKAVACNKNARLSKKNANLLALVSQMAGTLAAAKFNKVDREKNAAEVLGEEPVRKPKKEPQRNTKKERQSSVPEIKPARTSRRPLVRTSRRTSRRAPIRTSRNRLRRKTGPKAVVGMSAKAKARSKGHSRSFSSERLHMAEVARSTLWAALPPVGATRSPSLTTAPSSSSSSTPPRSSGSSNSSTPPRSSGSSSSSTPPYSSGPSSPSTPPCLTPPGTPSSSGHSLLKAPPIVKTMFRPSYPEGVLPPLHHGGERPPWSCDS